MPKSYISTKKKESSSSFFILSCHRKYRTNDIFSPLINYLKFSFDNEIDKDSIFRKIRVNYYMAKNVENGSLEHRPKLINFLSGDQSPHLCDFSRSKGTKGFYQVRNHLYLPYISPLLTKKTTNYVQLFIC